MFYHKYTCKLCSRVVTIPYKSYINPLYNKLAVHRDVCNGNNNPGWGWIPQGVIGEDKNCYGILLHRQDVEILELPPPPVPRTASDMSLEYSRSPGDKNTICGGVDITNPATKRKGVNNHGKQRASLHLSLQNILKGVGRLEVWDVTNCAEIDAVDELLKAGVASANIRVHSRDQFGTTKVPCENCQAWLTRGKDNVYKIRVF